MTTETSLSHPPTLYALVIRLLAGEEGTLRATQGELAHAAFLNVVHQADEGLAASLHEMDGRKPFTISPLRGYSRRGKGQLHIPAGGEGWLRITLLDAELFRSFIGYFLKGLSRAAIRLGRIPFQVSEILSSPDSHFLAGANSMIGLQQTWAAVEPATSQRTIPMTFGSPTAFSIRNEETPFRTIHVLPDPALVFGELARYWDELADDDTMDAVRSYAREAVVVSRHNIRTHMYHYRRSKQIGFTGNVSFHVLDKENVAMIRHLNRLADLAFYTGLGSKKTMGMGQVYRERKA